MIGTTSPGWILDLLLTLAAAYLLRFGAGKRGALTAGLVFALAFFTKQAVLILMIPILLLDALLSGGAR